MKHNHTSRTVLVTGGTDGLGAHLVRLHQRNNDRVISVGTRDEHDTPDFFRNHPLVHYIRCDLSALDSAQHVVNALRAASVARLHTVYFNAGHGYWGDFAQQAPQKMEELCMLTFLSPILLLRAIDNMIISGGEVKFISSVVRYLPRCEYALYAAAKAAMSETVRSFMHERTAHYRVTLLHPGAIATEFHRKSGMGERSVSFAQNPLAVARTVVRAHGGVKVIGVRNQPWRFVGNICSIISVVRGVLPQRRLSDDGTQAAQSGAGVDTSNPAKRKKNVCVAPHAVMIIGAAEGIGRELAYIHFGSVQQLILVDSNSTLLDQTVAALRKTNARETSTVTEITSLVCDVRLASDMAKVFTHIDRAPKPVCLYVTAAVSAVGPFASLPRAALVNVYKTNCVPTFQFIHYLMQRARHASLSIVLFSSLATFLRYPGAACYAGTKTFISALSYALGRAMNAGGLSVVYPGPIATNHASRYSPDNNRTSSRLPTLLAAERIVKALRRGKTVIFLRYADVCLAILGIVFPRLFGKIMHRVIYRKITTLLLPPQGSR